MPLDDIKNFLVLDERIATAGQPSEEQLRELAAAGYEAVVNLGLLDPRYCLPDEAGLARSLGLDYTHIPVPFDAPAVDDFRAFRATMDRLAGKRVLVHCAANFRVTSFVALWGEAAQGWPTERADALARTFWEPNETWQRFLADCRASRQPGF
ncbi:MAG: protein tyrosine phosphatase family protein [Deltaproteobacteria bacterium]|nr:protein tyrosine phosphatase family protein [Deltaproteobacteria bacterium]